MLSQNRIIFSNNGTLTDLSIPLSDYKAQTSVVDFTAGQDYIYIGGDMPFNHRYFELSVVNTEASTVTVDIWDGSEWEAAVDVLDETKLGSASLGQSGIIRWTPNRDTAWGTEDSTEQIPDLATLKIYDMYWVRLNFTATLTGTTAIKYVGHKFSEDVDLEAYYPDLNIQATKTGFKTGKTDWDDQHFAAAEEIIMKLRKKKKFFTPNLILEPENFNLSAVHKVAYNIFGSFGDDYKDNRLAADADFLKAFNGIDFDFDKDGDGRLDLHEKPTSTGWIRT